MFDSELNEQQLVRRQKMEQLRSIGVDPFPPEQFPVNTYAADIKAGYPGNPDAFGHVVIAGRMMSQRIMGKAAFANLQDR